MAAQVEDPLIRVYLAAWRGVNRVSRGLTAAATGTLMGLLSWRELEQVGASYYERSTFYAEGAHNLAGLKLWERRAIDQYFSECKRLVVHGAGAGREVIALQRSGFETVGYEPSEMLSRRARALVNEHAPGAVIECTERDTWPVVDTPFDGAVLGWGLYMLIPTQARRVAFLQGAQQCLKSDAPLLLSFLCRGGNERQFRLIAKIANALRSARRHEPIALGDSMDYVPSPVHYFTECEIREELRAGGFELVHFAQQPFGHAVATKI